MLPVIVTIQSSWFKRISDEINLNYSTAIAKDILCFNVMQFILVFELVFVQDFKYLKPMIRYFKSL